MFFGLSSTKLRISFLAFARAGSGGRE